MNEGDGDAENNGAATVEKKNLAARSSISFGNDPEEVWGDPLEIFKEVRDRLSWEPKTLDMQISETSRSLPDLYIF
uniref:Uncharacterized protein n=1 Tax=Panagrolaimus sp. ES5 TaxID=591445 RepID=A0AC34FVJ2_9BILA